MAQFPVHLLTAGELQPGWALAASASCPAAQRVVSRCAQVVLDLGIPGSVPTALALAGAGSRTFLDCPRVQSQPWRAANAFSRGTRPSGEEMTTANSSQRA